jgi:hypothetical protein
VRDHVIPIANGDNGDNVENNANSSLSGTFALTPIRANKNRKPPPVLTA